jgi:TldD protein
MKRHETRTGWRCFCLAFLFWGAMIASRANICMAQSPTDDVLMNALNDELQRSMSLRVAMLEPPYFVQYGVDDSSIYRLSASYGALVSSTFNRERALYGQVRVGSYELDNSNFAGRGGFSLRGLTSGTELPTDDDYVALRHAVWGATDSWYKSSATALAQKRAYMRERNVGERPHDFTKLESPTNAILDRAEFSFDRAVWEDYVRNISKGFASHPHIQDATVNLLAGAETRYLTNSEGTRLRYANTANTLRITAEVQAADGERISDSLTYFAWTSEQMPKLPAVLEDVKKLADRLGSASAAPILDDYVGPVLVEGLAASQLFRQLLAQGVAAQVDPVGSARSGDSTDGLESRLGKRILPVTFHIYDDPRQQQFQDTYLAGHYLYDDEGIPPERVEIVVDGKLDAMVTSRTPTKYFTRSNGHGRRGGGSTASSSIGCLYVESNKGATAEELKQELIDAADADGLKFGLRITNLQNRSGGGLSALAAALGRRGGGFSQSRVGDPIAIYKVFVADGHEEPVRGCEFVGLDVRSLRRIIAAGKDQTVHNTFGGTSPASSVIAPSVVFEEVELTKIKQEADKKPILASPLAR